MELRRNKESIARHSRHHNPVITVSIEEARQGDESWTWKMESCGMNKNRPVGLFEGFPLANFSGGELPERFNGVDCKSADDDNASSVRPNRTLAARLIRYQSPR